MSRFRVPALLLGLVLSANALAELRVYDVDEKYRQEVFSALRGILSSEHDRSGSVEMLPTGQILIDTSSERHEEVAAVLRAIAEHQAEPAPRVRLRYWAVLGTNAGGDTDTIGSAPPDMLSDVLEELERIHGPQTFRVLANATLVSESGQDAEMVGDPLFVMQEAFVQSGRLNAELEIMFSYRIRPGGAATSQDGQPNPFTTTQVQRQHIELNVSMDPGEFLVVGENTIREDVIGQGSLDGTIFYIVHWPAAD